MIRIGLFGTNGHQLPLALPERVRAKITAVADYPPLSPEHRPDGIKEYGSLPELLADSEIDLVSLCSARRSDQAGHALACLEAGKHVLAEKPGAFTDEELDLLLTTSQRTGREFREMADTMLDLLIQAIRRLVDSGELGTVVHVQAHKSYPWHDSRPQDFETDGGLSRWVGIHATRFIIAATGLKIASVSASATNLGNPGEGDIHIAGTYTMTLENGAVASMNLNYLNPRSFGSWGNEQIRVYGTRGMAESVDGFRRSHLYPEGKEAMDLPMPEHPLSPDYLEHYVRYLLDGTPVPTSREEEIAALRAAIAAHEAALTGKRVEVNL